MTVSRESRKELRFDGQYWTQQNKGERYGEECNEYKEKEKKIENLLDMHALSYGKVRKGARDISCAVP